ncbi:MAG: class I SAM-dependent methyltransferase [Abitibacteriaceae bacterium]|nr:class I SAM-dependent methyltransferase [Abditibacteriaceae bacterium]MBV9865761.1 class I SAM-dependent methyltransferase [Abditibacteriaceae bacterium]
MRLTTVPGSLLERVLLALGIVPTPLMDTMISLLLARSIMAGTKLGVFEALAHGPLTAEEVAARCGTNEQGTERLLFALAGARYLRFKGGKYDLAPVARKWLLKDKPRSMHDAVLHRYLDALMMEHAEAFVRTGQPKNFHEPGVMSPELWDIYQRGQRAGAVYSAPEVARRVPTLPHPQTMLDVGGAHGYFSVALCRRHPTLRSTILDLPDAVAQSEPRLAKEGWGERVQYRAGNALTEDFGEAQYDLVFIANLVHHFDAATNRSLMQRVARALRPGGTVVILEIIRSKTPRQAGQIGALLDFYFGMTSAAGTWSFDEMASWQRAAGLTVLKPIRLRLSPGYGMQAARKHP